MGKVIQERKLENDYHEEEKKIYHEKYAIITETLSSVPASKTFLTKNLAASVGLVPDFLKFSTKSTAS